LPPGDIFSPAVRFFQITVFAVVYGVYGVVAVFLLLLLRSLAVAPPFAAYGGSVGLPLIQGGQ